MSEKELWNLENHEKSVEMIGLSEVQELRELVLKHTQRVLNDSYWYETHPYHKNYQDTPLKRMIERYQESSWKMWYYRDKSMMCTHMEIDQYITNTKLVELMESIEWNNIELTMKEFKTIKSMNHLLDRRVEQEKD